MKKYIVLSILFFLLFITAGCSEDRSFSIDDVTIDARIGEDGIIHVRELYTYTFDGSYEGMTRSIGSDERHFEAYLTSGEDPTEATKDLKALEIEEEDDAYKIYTDSKDETKKVLYSYDVEGSVKKYTDAADLKYAFFDESNETDLHNVAISIHTPTEVKPENIHSFLHKDRSGELSVTWDGIHYKNELLKAGKTPMIRFVFPAEQLSGMELDKDKAMEAEILAAEQELADRRANLTGNMEKAIPFIWILMGIVIVAAIFIFLIHPNRYRGDKSEDALLRVLENTDPLFVKYMHQGEYLSNDSFISGLFSLKQRGIVKLEEVPSAVDEGDMTFRFTWIRKEAEVDMADHYLYSWLFTENDKQGDYFLLESLLDSKKESETVRKEKAKDFESHHTTWSGLVKGRERYQGLRHAYKGFSFFSIPLVIFSFGLFYYFTTIDPISQTQQWVTTSILGVLAVVGLLFNRNKWVLSIYYFAAIVITLTGFSLMLAVVLTSIFYAISWLALIIIPSYYRDKDLRILKYAMKTAHDLFKKNHYPIGSDPDKIEQRITYAIILGAGKEYGEQCGKEEQVAKLKSYYPLLNNPVYATTSFSAANVALYATVAQSSSTSSTSATGGGGAGAF